MTLNFKVAGKELKPDALKHEVLKRVHKFSIGKDFDSTETADTELLDVKYKTDFYTNIPPTLSTKETPTETKQHSTEDIFISSKQSSPAFSSYYRSPFSPTFSPLSASSINKEYASSNNQKANPFEVKKWDEIRKNLNKINKKTGSNVLNKILNDVLVSKSIDYENLAKGRTIDDTKAVLNYMILALHQIKSKQQPNFDSMKFLDQVTLNI